MLKELLSTINKRYPLASVDSSEFDGLKVSHMKFRIKSYEARGLGAISVMAAVGFFGLMRMETLIVLPRELDLPLLSYDRIHAFGKETIILDLYDTFINPCDLTALDRIKEEYRSFTPYEKEKGWYDAINLPQTTALKGKKKDAPQFDELCRGFFDAYLEIPADPVTDIETKKKKTAAYREGLLKNGGTSTNIFVKELGREKTEKLYEEILFRTEVAK